MPSVPQPRTGADAERRVLATPIDKPVQVLVEGGDDLAFVRAILAADTVAQARIQVHSCGGKQGIPVVLGTLAQQLPDTVAVKVVVVRDADDSVTTAQADCIRYFRDLGFRHPGGPAPQGWPSLNEKVAHIETSWLLLPGHGRPGTLETLILEALANDAGKPLATAMLDGCTAARTGDTVTWPGPRARKNSIATTASAEKAQVQAFLAAFAVKGYRLPSSAFEEGVLDAAHPAFNDLRQALLAL